jgi:EAL domain-containing protein (putative c-di-GMP-specific phosphodiesterase class I)
MYSLRSVDSNHSHSRAENASRPQLEITASALVGDLEEAQEILGSLRKAGVKIVLDNFGTGYSSFYHLRNFKLDKIKIDTTKVRRS